ncbi:MAG: hypothetical protein DRQ39_11525 [Gammaproteobacteria bacterium]|nr:MAG: hypothetical protein DRQ39_11525 [Gammaproteobacteria bacterium]
MFTIILMQILGIVSLCVYAFMPLVAAAIVIDGMINGAKDFRHGGLRTLYRLMLCPIVLICINLSLPAIFELCSLLFYMLP